MQRIHRNILSAIVIIIAAGSGSVLADDYRRDEHRRGHDRHMVFDNRHGHGHYYPEPGFMISVLPVNAITIGYGRDRYFFQGGVWYRPGPRGYMVIRAPIGIGLPVLPPDYSTVWVDGVAYYYANNVYYAGNPGSYVVVAPPTHYVERPDAGQSAPPGAPASVPQPAPGTWYYCEASKAYYPYVAECKSGWRAVPATPPR